MKLVQIKLNWVNQNCLEFEVTFPWLVDLAKNLKVPVPKKKLVLVGIVGGTAYGEGWRQGGGSSAPIRAIKELRAITGYGLKEAKDIIDAIRDGETWTFAGDTPPDVSGCQYLRFEWR
ncbi:MAG: ribosomal protein L7/L12 [Bacilli bacterium]|jgi:aspartate ammonia-lyase